MSSHSMRVAAWGYLVLGQPHLKVGQDQQPARGQGGTCQKCSSIKTIQGAAAGARGGRGACLAWQIRRWKFTFLLLPLLLLRAHKIQINDKTTTTRQKPQPEWGEEWKGEREEGSWNDKRRNWETEEGSSTLPATFAFHCQNANLAAEVRQKRPKR